MSRLGKYQLVAELARGGMGIVYLATAQGPARFSKLLVVKELRTDLGDEPGALDMFLEEARLAARLDHPNIVQTYEIGEHEGRHFIVMEYLDGVTLARAIRKLKAFPLTMHLRLICDLLPGLHYAHMLRDFDETPLGIVHRDVTPQNVFLTYGGQVKLVDFGIAKADDSVLETRAGMLKGKPAYMAPEQIAGSARETSIDARTDVFAVGIMLWEATAGRRLWQNHNDIEILSSLMRKQLPSLLEAAPEAPAELVRICGKAMATARDERYASVADLRADLEAYLRASQADVSLGDVAEFVSRAFEQERIATRHTIETYIQRLRSGAIDADAAPLRRSSLEPGSGSGINPLPSLTPSGAELSPRAATGDRRAGGSRRALGGVLLGLLAAAGLAVWTAGGACRTRPVAGSSVSSASTAASSIVPGDSPAALDAAAESARTESMTTAPVAVPPRDLPAPHVLATPRLASSQHTRPSAAPAVVAPRSEAPSPPAPPASALPRVRVLDDGPRVKILE